MKTTERFWKLKAFFG